ncbi:MAG TPA: DUF87 domain-containing protein [Ktedonobacteraceae bacterium]|nr:DUF87 domain-containing protein [Ktedonobacteraceae bacterium]
MPVLSIDSSNKFQLQPQTLVGRSIAVLGITGSGKTNTAAVLIEELLSSGLPLTIVDIEGEYWGLKERFEVLVAGRSEHSELEVGPGNAAKLAEISVTRGISVILDLSDFTQDEAYEFLVQYFTSLWAACSSSKQPYQIVLEEAHEFIPQGAGTPLKQILTRIALRGRKRGLGIILISQRSAKVEKDVLTQASLLFLHKVIHPIDLKVYKDLIPLPSAEVEIMIRKLQPGEAIVIYNNQVNILHIRLRRTFHVGSTPTHAPITQPTLRKLDNAMLKELRSMIVNAPNAPTANDERVKLLQKINELEEIVTLKDNEIQRLQSQIDLLSKLSIRIDGFPNGSHASDSQVLEVDQAIIRQVITGEKPLSDSFSNITTSKSNTANFRLPDLSLSQVEQRKLDSLIRRIQKLPKLQRSILHLLAEHEGTAMTVPMIATWLSLKESTIRSRPPHDLMKMKLITRTRGRRGYKYTSLVYAYLQTEFPHGETKILIKWLFQ